MRYMHYLCGGIWQNSNDEATLWRQKVIVALGKEYCLDPMVRDYRGIENENVEAIVEQDLADIAKSDIIIVNAETVRGWGSPMEVRGAWLDRKHIVTYHPTPKSTSPWLQYHSNFMFSSLDALIEYVIGVNDKVTNIRAYVDQFYKPKPTVTRGTESVPRSIGDAITKTWRNSEPVKLKDMIPDSTLVCGPGLPMGNAIIIGEESRQR